MMDGEKCSTYSPLYVWSTWMVDGGHPTANKQVYFSCMLVQLDYGILIFSDDNEPTQAFSEWLYSTFIDGASPQ